MKKKWLIAGAIVWLLPAGDASACGACMYGIFDWLLPPIKGWVLLAVAWSFVLSGYSTFTGVPIWGVFRLLGWIATVIILALTSLMYFGPVFLLLLMLPCIVSSVYAYLPDKMMDRKVKRDLKVIGAVGLAGLAFMTVTMQIQLHNRSEAAFILKWENTFQSQKLLEGLAQATPPKLNQLREVIRHAKSDYILAKASQGIATHGDAAIDVPLLIDAYMRTSNKDENRKIEQALARLTGLNLPEGSPPDIWKATWAGRNNNPSN